MRHMKLSALTILLAFTLAGCEKPVAVPKTNAGSTAASVAVVAALPNFTELVKKVGPAVVNISSTRKIREGFEFHVFPRLSPDDPFYEFFHRFLPGGQHEYNSQSLGSGFVINADGYILTNAHVVEDSDEIVVRLIDKREFKAKVIGSDRRSDIALLKINAKELPVVSLGNSSKLEVGEWVVAIGSPFGFSNSVSQGIVSAKGRSLPGESLVPFIQTDVPINPGNSGGPLFNMNGEVVGINSQIYSRSGGNLGLSFAIPIDFAMKVEEELQKHGAIRRGRLGITIQNVTPEHAKSFDLEKASGALITSVEKGGPADRAGLEIGDIILKFNGREIAGSEDLLREVADSAPGSRAKLAVWHRGAAHDVTVSLSEADVERMAQKPQNSEPAQLGLTLHELTRDEQRELQTGGFLEVEAVAGVAAESGITPGDIILAINSQRVSSISQLRTELAKLGRRAAVLVQREGHMIFIPLKFSGE